MGGALIVTKLLVQKENKICDELIKFNPMICHFLATPSLSRYSFSKYYFTLHYYETLPVSACPTTSVCPCLPNYLCQSVHTCPTICLSTCLSMPAQPLLSVCACPAASVCSSLRACSATSVQPSLSALISPPLSICLSVSCLCLCHSCYEES